MEDDGLKKYEIGDSSVIYDGRLIVPLPELFHPHPIRP